MPKQKKSDAKEAAPKFTVPEQFQPFLEILDEGGWKDDRVRLNFTLPRYVEITYRKGCDPIRIDRARYAGEQTEVRCFTYGEQQHLTDGIQASESETTDGPRPKGDKWKDAKSRDTTNGKKKIWTRTLDPKEKDEAAFAHASARVEVLYGDREMSGRDSVADPIGEEMRKFVVKLACNPKNSLVDSEGNNWKPATLPHVLRRARGCTVVDVQAEASLLGIPDEVIVRLQGKAAEIVRAMDLDSLLDNIEV